MKMRVSPGNYAWRIIDRRENVIAEVFHHPEWNAANVARQMASASVCHDSAHRLAMLVLQSHLYGDDFDIRDAVDSVLDIHAVSEGRS